MKDGVTCRRNDCSFCGYLVQRAVRKQGENEVLTVLFKYRTLNKHVLSNWKYLHANVCVFVCVATEKLCPRAQRR